MNVDDLVRIRIEEAARKVAAARKRRADLNEARQHGIAARHRAKLARQQQAGIVPCPVCSAESTYSRELDRYVHYDGSDNRPCWLATSRGQTDPLQP